VQPGPSCATIYLPDTRRASPAGRSRAASSGPLEIVEREKSYSQELQRAGKWVHIWRIVGEYANFSIFDVESNDELHTLLSGLPLFSCKDIHVTPRATHPSDIKV
jgi:muconolactone D-isomerase